MEDSKQGVSPSHNDTITAAADNIKALTDALAELAKVGTKAVADSASMAIGLPPEQCHPSQLPEWVLNLIKTAYDMGARGFTNALPQHQSSVEVAHEFEEEASMESHWNGFSCEVTFNKTVDINVKVKDLMDGIDVEEVMEGRADEYISSLTHIESEEDETSEPDQAGSPEA